MGRLTRLEEKVHGAEGRTHLWAIAKELPWRHILTVAALVVLSLMGHLTPAEIKRWLMGG